MRVIAMAVLWTMCPLLRHPPRTSFMDEDWENMIERQTNLMRMRGDDLLVQCACGRKMVDPIYRPWWRPTR